MEWMRQRWHTRECNPRAIRIYFVASMVYEAVTDPNAPSRRFLDARRWVDATQSQRA